MSDIGSALDDVATRWSADGHVEQVKGDKVVKQFEAANADPAALPASPQEAAEAANLVWTALDIGATKLGGERYKLAPQEKAALIEASVPVLQKYLPDFRIGPEWTLAGVVAAIYLPKFMPQDGGTEMGKNPSSGPDSQPAAPAASPNGAAA